MVERGEENIEDVQKLARFAETLAGWDPHIVEIFPFDRTDNTTKRVQQLICVFRPEPATTKSGLITCLNLLIRNDEEKETERLNIELPLDLGFVMGNKIYLPNGEIQKYNCYNSPLFQRNDG